MITAANLYKFKGKTHSQAEIFSWYHTSIHSLENYHFHKAQHNIHLLCRSIVLYIFQGGKSFPTTYGLKTAITGPLFVALPFVEQSEVIYRNSCLFPVSFWSISHLLEICNTSPAPVLLFPIEKSFWADLSSLSQGYLSHLSWLKLKGESPPFLNSLVTSNYKGFIKKQTKKNMNKSPWGPQYFFKRPKLQKLLGLSPMGKDRKSTQLRVNLYGRVQQHWELGVEKSLALKIYLWVILCISGMQSYVLQI